MKTVVLGGYGNFGMRICRVLAACPEIELVVAGRDAARGAAFAAELGGRATAMALDLHGPDLARRLRAVGAELVIHTAGPFQSQGYAVGLAVAAAGAHYIDIADGRRFVCDFPAALGPAFRAAGRLALCGASTVPALSSAVVDHLTAGWKRIDSIDLCIAPAQTAPRGVATMAAVLSYCGAPVQVWRDGAWTALTGWANPARVQFARIRPRLGAVCDIPDLELFPARYQRLGVRSVLFRAALEIGLTQRVFAAMAQLRRLRLLPRPDRFAGALNTLARAFDVFGSSRGGMVVRVVGADAAGRAAQRSWHITADNDHGPEIPCMAAILMARKLARGEVADAAGGGGADTCQGWLALEEFRPEFERWNMVTEVVEETPEAGSKASGAKGVGAAEGGDGAPRV